MMDNKLKASKECEEIIKEFEDFMPTKYLDAVGKPTIGFGTLIDTPEEQWLLTARIDKNAGVRLMQKDINIVEGYIKSWFKDVELNQHQFDALISFVYNNKPLKVKESTLVKMVKRDPNNPLIANEWKKWIWGTKPDGTKTKLNGLIRRRDLETFLYFRKS